MDEDVTKQLAFGLVHADVHGDDFRGRPRWHARADKYSAGADLVPGLGQFLERGSDSELCQMTGRGNAPVDALLGCLRWKSLGSVIRCEVAFGEKPKLATLEDLRGSRVAYRNENRPSRPSLEADCDAHRARDA